jgi:hypothetical protein
LLTIAGCHGPISPNVCTILCSTEGSCPSSLSCGADGYCHASGEDNDCSPPQDPLPDASGFGFGPPDASETIDPPADAGPPPDASPEDAPPRPDAMAPMLLHIEAVIDGRSRLILQGGEAKWLHIDHAAPGRLGGTNYPTVINGSLWTPEWPAPGENRSCVCESNVFEDVMPVLPAEEMQGYFWALRARDAVRLIEAPSPENGYRFVIEFDDNDSGGQDVYIIELELYPL